jgi:hypothetical protein
MFLFYSNVFSALFFFTLSFIPMFHSGMMIHRLIHPFSPKVITISPGGYKGYYLLGVTSYIREHFNTDKCIFSGASAGAWFSLLMTYRGNHSLLLQDLNVLSPEFVKQNLKQIQDKVSRKILEKYKTEDFDLKRLYVGVSRFRPFYVETDIYSSFRDLEDAVHCCQASSHIPFITGGMLRVYDRRLTFDGGFSVYPYLNESEPVLHICTEVWSDDKEKKERWNRQNPLVKNIRIVMEQTTLFSKDKFNLVDMYWQGYRDTEQNHAKLAELFPSISLKNKDEGLWR